MKTEETSDYTFRITNGILFIEFPKPFNLTFEKAKELVKARLNFSDEKSYPVVFDIRNINKVEKEARKFLDQNGQKGMTSVSLIIKSGITIFIANTYFKLANQAIPTKMFNNIEDAEAWAKRFVS